MTENKRYSEQNLENHLNRIYDNQECKVIFDEDINDLLNEQDERIKDLETRNNRQYERLKELTDLMYKRDWETLNDMVDEWEREDEYLRKYGG